MIGFWIGIGVYLRDYAKWVVGFGWRAVGLCFFNDCWGLMSEGGGKRGDGQMGIRNDGEMKDGGLEWFVLLCLLTCFGFIDESRL